MIKKLLLSIALIGIISSAYSQSIEINGQIIDKNTGIEIADAHITTTTGVVTFTDESGLFTIVINGTPAVIRITHVAYGIIEYKVSTLPKGLLVISIEKQISTLGEVQITEKQLRILTQKDQFSIQEFAIDQNVIWFLGFINNQANRKRLFLANLYGDTISSISVKRAESLYQDVFNNVHVITKDSVYQVFYPGGEKIEFLYSAAKNHFFSIMGDIELAFNNKLVYKEDMSGLFGIRLYYIQQDDPVQYQLAYMSDTLEAFRRITTGKIDRLMAYYNIPELANMWTTIGRYRKKGSKFDEVIRHHVPYELFQSDDKLFIINYLKDSMLCYTSDGTFDRAIHIDFHKEKFLAGTDYKDLTCLTDPVSQSVYLLNREMAEWELWPLDLSTGKPGNKILLPDFPGMDGICVYNNAVYFIYQEKQYPYYNRLYRYQLYSVL